ncbi:MAG: toxin-antitoxin system YwqK family antitoxin [Verrucomicrobiota bacterium]|nr:toxin-antitoxin system YwqK family antitoxin [Verrucomicrobiota bacterium]
MPCGGGWVGGVKILFYFLSIGLFIAGYVNSESKPDLTDTAPKKDRMKDAVEWSKLQNRNGDTYIPNTDKPYSGWAKQIYDNGQVKVLAEFTDGTATRLKQWQENGIPRWDIGYSKGRISLSDVPLEDWRDSNSSLQHGLMTSWRENGQKEKEVNYKDGKQHGLETFWYENGQKKTEGNYKDDKLDGLETSWRENGQKEKEVNYKDGKQHGLETFWYENGQKEIEQNYKDGKQHGLVTFWYKNGQKSGEDVFKEDKLLSSITWKPNGEKCPLTNVKNGDGVMVYYYENGKKSGEDNYKDGMMNGLSTLWYENGQKSDEINFKDDKENGLWISYNEDGTERRRETYKDGELVED